MPVSSLNLKKKDLLQLMKNFYQFMTWIDVEMRKPFSNEREKKIAEICNQLEMRLDIFSRNQLDLSFRKIANMKKLPKKTG